MIHLEFGPAGFGDAAELAALHTAVAESLTEKFGKGPWSMRTSERGVLHALRTTSVYIARDSAHICATLQLTSKKPWAIDTAYFSPCLKPIYLVGMAVAPAMQRQGIGRICLQKIQVVARELPVDAIRLDAYDAVAGAGKFYEKCGYAEVGRAVYRNAPLIYYELRLRERGSVG